MQRGGDYLLNVGDVDHVVAIEVVIRRGNPESFADDLPDVGNGCGGVAGDHGAREARDGEVGSNRER